MQACAGSERIAACGVAFLTATPPAANRRVLSFSQLQPAPTLAKILSARPRRDPHDPHHETLDVKPSGNAQAATYDFLQPPRAADEMGRLGPYRIRRVLGTGAMGVVFLAEDTRCWRQVALKALKPNLADNDKARQRFLPDCQATQDLKPDHAITTHEVAQA